MDIAINIIIFIDKDENISRIQNVADDDLSDIIRTDNRALNVSVSKLHCKKYYCLYCKKLITNYGRHLLSIHKDQKEVAHSILSKR